MSGLEIDDVAERSLLIWIQSFEDIVVTYDGPTVHTLEDLADGVFLTHVMHHIGADYVNLELVNRDATGNWALKASNIRALVRSIDLYYREEQAQLCDAQEIVDAMRIAQHDDAKEICRLIELLLGCAVHCPSKSECIHSIMQMERLEQASMMHMIENNMHRFQSLASPTSGPHQGRNSMGYLTHEGESDESLHVQLTQALARASQLELRFLDMERDKRELTERLENVLAEKHELAAKHATLADERDKLVSERQSTLTRDNKKIQQIVEGEIHALTVQLEAMNDQLIRAKRESSERMMVLEHEVRRQADELDISRSKISQLGKLEASVAKYKKKLEEMNALRTQVRDLETHNAQYLDKVLDLESTVKTIPALKMLVEKYKNQVVELETAHLEARSHTQIKEQKIRRLQEELDSALGGKEFLENQVEELRSQVASLHHHHAGQEEDDGDAYDPSSMDAAMSRTGSGGRGALGGRDESSSIDSSGSQGSRMGSSGTGGFSAADLVLGTDSVAALRERVARLERENSELKHGAVNTEQTHLANELDMAIKAKESLQTSLFELRRQNDQLFDELETLRQQQQQQIEMKHLTGASSSSTAGSSGDRAGDHASSLAGVSPGKPSGAVNTEKIAEYEERISVLQLEGEAAESMRVTVSELTNRLKDKESMINELSEQRAKLENYTKKTLHAVQTKYMVAVSSHRNQINEKQERIDFLETKMKETRASFSREQALMMSSFYELGTEMQRRTMMPQAPGQTAQPAAWLASKRTEERAKRRQL